MAKKSNFEKMLETSPELLDTDNWKGVLVSALSEADKITYLKRKEAIDMYTSRNYTKKEIQNVTGVATSQVTPLFDKCTSFDENGELLGYRALIPYYRVSEYKRQKSDDGVFENKPSNHSGSFSKLLETHPEIEDFLIKRILNKSRGVKEAKVNIRTLHKDFLKTCEACGVDPIKGEYPFNTENLGERALQRFIKSYKMQNSSKFIHESGKDAKSLHFSSGIGEKEKAVVRPYQRVEFDGHKLDVLASVPVTTPEGDVVERVMGRFWLCMIIDVGTRCILGYHISVNSEYNQFDILQTIENAIIPWKPRKFTVNNLAYSEKGGFVSACIPELQYALWNELAFDNAKSHYARRVQQKIEDTVGCSVVYGPAGTPTRRPFIERVFQTLESRGLHRTAVTTGSQTKDPIRINPEASAVKNKVRFEEIVDVIEVLIHEYNGERHSGINFLSPLEVMKQRIQNSAILPRTASEDISLSIFTTTRKVIGKMGSGRRPHINFEGAVYTSDVLAGNYELCGITLHIEYDTKDISKVLAYFPDGSSLGYLYAKGGWNYQQHDLRTRQLINKAKNKNELPDNNFIDPITAFHQHLNDKAMSEKKATNKLKNLTIKTSTTSESTKIDESTILQTDEDDIEFEITDELLALKKGRKSFNL